VFIVTSAISENVPNV